MDPLARKCLEDRVLAEVQTLLTEGDHVYFQHLSPTDFLEALENELRFLGFYTHSDRETPVVIRAILEQHVDQWRAYIREQQEPAVPVQIAASPWIQTTNSAATGLLMTKATQYIGFMFPMERLAIQMSSLAVQDQVS